VEAYLHETAADVLFALPDVSPELCARTLTPYLGFKVQVRRSARTARSTLACSTALVTSQPNGLIQETVRAFLRTWYRELVVGVPAVEDGRISAGDVPGHGVSLREDLPAGAWVSRMSLPGAT
jgi:L-alanine-DL-glutamate epimerase-like enolase superfamily enzyme